MTVVDWLLDSDPSVRWQVMRDLTDASEEEISAERGRIAVEGAGARLLALQAADGRWGGAAWNRGWDSTMHVLWPFVLEQGLEHARGPDAGRDRRRRGASEPLGYAPRAPRAALERAGPFVSLRLRFWEPALRPPRMSASTAGVVTTACRPSS